MKNVVWNGITDVSSISYDCSFCGREVASNQGWQCVNGANRGLIMGGIRVCHYCGNPTYLDFAGGQHPAPTFGKPVNDVSDEGVSKIYEEARAATSAGAYTAAVLCCRKLLMHVAVSKGAEEDKGFAYYAKYLADNHYVPPDAKGWVDHIKDKGNEANHEIKLMTSTDAEDLISFSEMLLKQIFEFPARMQRK